MKNLLNFFFLPVVLVFSYSLSGFSQYTVTKVVGQSVNTSADGFYYALPQTVLKVDLVVEKLQRQKGPLSEFTQEYLGTSEYLTENSVSYRLINVELDQLIETDPTQIYYVQFPLERSKDAKASGFTLTPFGTLLGFDLESQATLNTVETDIHQTIVVADNESGFDYFADYNRKKKVDTIVRKITIDTVTIDRFLFKTTWVDKSKEEKANDAAMQIARIREFRFNLITGYQEVNYGESMKYMDQQLKQLEKDYLDLFLGKESKSIELQTVYFIPTEENKSTSLYKGGDGSSIEIKITSNGTTDLLPDTPLAKQNSIFYRIPEKALVEVTQDGTAHYRNSILINQLGVVATAPLNKTKLQFNPTTGGLIKIIRE